MSPCTECPQKHCYVLQCTDCPQEHNYVSPCTECPQEHSPRNTVHKPQAQRDVASPSTDCGHLETLQCLVTRVICAGLAMTHWIEERRHRTTDRSLLGPQSCPPPPYPSSATPRPHAPFPSPALPKGGISRPSSICPTLVPLYRSR